MSVGAAFDHVTLFDLFVKERVEGFPARAEGIDLTHEREYRSQGFFADTEPGNSLQRRTAPTAWYRRIGQSTRAVAG